MKMSDPRREKKNNTIKIKVMLTCVFKVEVKKLKTDYIKNIIFTTFKILNIQVSKKTFIFNFLTYALKIQVSISLKVII